MSWWVYFASEARADEADTLRFALEQKVLYRPTHTEDGTCLIANVGRLRPGDHILLVYRGADPPRARVLGRIAAAEDPVPGIKVVDRIRGDLAIAMSKKGYPLLADGCQEVIRLEDPEPCNLLLKGSYAGHNAIHRLEPVDRADVWGLIRRTSE